ncbi:hypothetical protein WKW80_31860 [Variovorax humicola]|uniref:Uncharacterized protein n=1 Tax=Variovorax humicola TaxID=1769758 RepID=A0ABU8WAL6_9BURK
MPFSNQRIREMGNRPFGAAIQALQRPPGPATASAQKKLSLTTVPVVD